MKLTKIMRSLLFAAMATLFTVGGPRIALAGGPMKMAYGWSVKTDAAEAVKEAVAMMHKGLGGDSPKLVVISTTGKLYDEKQVFVALKKRLKPDVRLWGANSDLIGTPTPKGMRVGLTVMGFHSPSMVVGVGSADLDWQNLGSYRGVGKKAITAALIDAGKSASNPPSVVMFAGTNLVTDTGVFRGIEEVVGKVPMFGANASREVDELVLGDGWTFSSSRAAKNSVSVAAIWADTKVGIAYGYGYTERPELHGIVTKSDVDKRILYEIDHRPAADVYNEWLGGKLTGSITAGGGNVPLDIVGTYGFRKPIQAGTSDYVIVGVMGMSPDKSLHLSHEALDVGTEVSLIQLAVEKELVKKAAIVSVIARNRGKINKNNIAGGLLVYCAAPFMVAQGRGYDIQPTFPLLSQSLNGAPFTGFLAGGEIGNSPVGGNRMMALSAVVIVFGKN